jgi:oxygen-independent coproporphyrinogen-3 oxidase
MVYWRGHDYAGIGPGAHGRLQIGDARFATETEKHPETWLEQVETNGHGLIVNEALGHIERADEYLLMGLRLAEGIEPKRFAAIAGRELDADKVSFLREQGTVELTADGKLRVTMAGFPILDAVVADLAA